MKENYSYPIELDWNNDELISVLDLLQTVEKAYEGGVEAADVLSKYQTYKKYFKAMSEEKILDRNFKQVSGYSLYQVVKAAKNCQQGRVRL